MKPELNSGSSGLLPCIFTLPQADEVGGGESKGTEYNINLLYNNLYDG